jgi:hypothetical protein
MDQGILDRACLSFPTHLTCTRTLTSGPFLSALQAIACTILSTCVFFLGGYLHRREEQKYAKLEAAATNDDLAPAVADADRLSNSDEKEVPVHEEDVSRPTDGTMDREHATLPHTHQFSQTDREREAKILPQPNTTV